ncbi:MAG: hypothetical protein JNL13_07860 [Chitinophagaceae bacterium]|nr:hypothetical protein [Chitinophagaceae bacterium]
MNIKNDAHSLILDYVSTSKYLINLLKEMLPSDVSILRGRVLKLIPAQGEIDGIKYEIHGKGCYFEFANWHVDIDMGINDCYNCFDSWKLFDFLNSMDSQKREKFKKLEDVDILNSQIQELIANGVILKNGNSTANLSLVGALV